MGWKVRFKFVENSEWMLVQSRRIFKMIRDFRCSFLNRDWVRKRGFSCFSNIRVYFLVVSPSVCRDEEENPTNIKNNPSTPWSTLEALAKRIYFYLSSQGWPSVLISAYGRSTLPDKHISKLPFLISQLNSPSEFQFRLYFCDCSEAQIKKGFSNRAALLSFSSIRGNKTHVLSCAKSAQISSLISSAPCTVSSLQKASATSAGPSQDIFFSTVRIFINYCFPTRGTFNLRSNTILLFPSQDICQHKTPTKNSRTMKLCSSMILWTFFSLAIQFQVEFLVSLLVSLLLKILFEWFCLKKICCVVLSECVDLIETATIVQVVSQTYDWGGRTWRRNMYPTKLYYKASNPRLRSLWCQQQ